MKKLLLIITILLFCCSTEPEDNSELFITIPIINSSSILIQFSQKISLDDFDADEIYYSEDLVSENLDEEQTDTSIIENSNIIKIVSSNYIKLNDESQTLWYDSTNFSCAIIDKTTLDSPDGGIGDYYPQIGENILTIGNDFTHSFNIEEGLNDDDINEVKIVPNPFIIRSGFNNESEYIQNIRFTRLPIECHINIYNENGLLIKQIYHNDLVDGNEYWNLKDSNDNNVTSNIYYYNIESDSNISENKVFVIIK